MLQRNAVKIPSPIGNINRILSSTMSWSAAEPLEFMRPNTPRRLIDPSLSRLSLALAPACRRLARRSASARPTHKGKGDDGATCRRPMISCVPSNAMRYADMLESTCRMQLGVAAAKIDGSIFWLAGAGCQSDHVMCASESRPYLPRKWRWKAALPSVHAQKHAE